MAERTMLWWPAFDSLWHGGGHRSAQLREVFEERGIALHRVEVPPAASRLRRAFTAVRRNCFPVAAERALLRRSRRAAPAARVLLWEATSRPRRAALARGVGLRTVAFPQNLESLVPAGLFAARDVPAGFRRELRALACADMVVTIAPDEAWLLGLFGVQATCLPYFPPAQLRSRFEAVRRARTHPPARSFLLMGSHGNPPTRRGTTELLGLLASIAGPQDRFVVAGDRSEAMHDVPRPQRTEVRGRVPDDELDALLATSSALLVHQPATTGAITRITEALCAGLPVVANEFAARGVERLEGVHVYRGAEELRALLAGPLPAPAAPPRPLHAEAEIVARVLELA